MHSIKPGAFFIVLLIHSCVLLAQDPDEGFATNVRIDSARNVLKNYLKSPDKKYLTDPAGSGMAPGYLFNDISLSNYELFAANFSFSEKDQVIKIGFQPFKLLDGTDPFTTFIGNFKINIAQKKDLTTFGAGISGDNSSPFSNRGLKLLKDYFDKETSPAPPPPFDSSPFDKQRNELNAAMANKQIGETEMKLLLEVVNDKEKAARAKEETEYQKYLDKYKTDILDKTLLNYDIARMRNVFKWTLGYSSQFFSILGARGQVDAFDSVNFHSNKAGILTVNASYSYQAGKFSVKAEYNSIESRKNAAKLVEKIHYDSYSFGVAARVVSFLEGEKLEKNPNFVKSLFIPSIALGISWEMKKTDSEKFQFVEDRIQRTRVFMPYIDVLITPAIQFRVGLPFQKNSLVDGSKLTFLGANLQYGIKFSNLN